MSALQRAEEEMRKAGVDWQLIHGWVEIAHNYAVVNHDGDRYSDTGAATQAAIEAAATNPDPSRSTQLWQAAAQAWAKDATIFPLLSFNRYYAVSPRVGGFVWPQQDHYDLSQVWVADA